MADNISPPEDFHSSLLDAGEERYRAFIANSSEGIWRFELEEPVETVLAADEQIELFYRRGYLAECNDAMARMYGYARAEEIVGARLGDLLVRTDPANVEYLRAFVASGYRLTDVESVERDRDGRIKHFSNNLVGVVEGGKILRAWGTQRDSTERKLIEEEARRLADIVEATTDFVAVTGADARLVYINRAGRRMVGVAEDADAQEFVGGSLSPEWAYERTVREWLPRALAEGSASGEGALRTLEGKEIPVSFVMLVHRDAAGEPLYVSTIARDITERKRAEAERELLLARERAARTAAEEANRLKDEFLATLSHELRTPLTAILGWAHMLKAGGLDEATALHAVETVERNALAQRQLVEDVLDVSRIVTGQLRIEQTAVGLLDVVRAALDSVRPAADAKRIELQCSFDPRAGQVAGDPARLQQVVWNLLSNAVKFTPAGGAVRIAVERLLAQTRITISDTGQGITPDFLPYVFERFRQADQSTTRQHGGLGLGLAIVRHLVEEHGGSVHAYSAGAGQGATFTVDLPPLHGDADAAAQARVLKAAARAGGGAHTSAGEDDDEVAPPLVGLRVLLVDDDEDAAEVLAAFLYRAGAEVAAAASAPAALKELGAREFDVIVSDIAMPGEDGYELMRKARALADARAGQTPAVALTAYAGDSDRARALRAGFQRHLAKPVDPRELLEVIADLAGKAKAP